MTARSVELARSIRADVLRMTSMGKSSHVGSGLSVADILAVLYADIARHDARDPLMPGRDRVILSKGHAGAAMYAVLAETGYFPVSQLETHCQDGSLLSGHVSHLGIPGVDLSTGSLGHGLSVGCGMALRSNKRSLGFRVFVVMSDGECDEGSVWEAAMFAAHHRLPQLVAIVDYNKMQSLGTTTATLDLEPFAAKWEAFGWRTREVDGHCHPELAAALVDNASDDRPLCVIAHTVKGRGVPFMENEVLWHYRAPSDDELGRALRSLAEAD